jgi:hypothetical protein
VAGVAGSLLDEMQQHPPERDVPPVTQRPDRYLIQARRAGHDVPAALAGLAIAALQLLRLKLSRSTELPVRIRLPSPPLPTARYRAGQNWRIPGRVHQPGRYAAPGVAGGRPSCAVRGNGPSAGVPPSAVNLAGAGTAVITTRTMPAPLLAHHRVSPPRPPSRMTLPALGCRQLRMRLVTQWSPDCLARTSCQAVPRIEFLGGDRGRSRSDAVLVAGEAVDLVVLGPGPDRERLVGERAGADVDSDRAAGARR